MKWIRGTMDSETEKVELKVDSGRGSGCTRWGIVVFKVKSLRLHLKHSFLFNQKQFISILTSNRDNVWDLRIHLEHFAKKPVFVVGPKH